MKQVVFVSGKGGTGKSRVVASLSRMVRDKMLADYDVDAPNLHVLLEGNRLREDYCFGGSQAVIDPFRCVQCGRCLQACRLPSQAISSTESTWRAAQDYQYVVPYPPLQRVYNRNRHVSQTLYLILARKKPFGGEAVRLPRLHYRSCGPSSHGGCAHFFTGLSYRWDNTRCS